jgi:hypothetical protein
MFVFYVHYAVIMNINITILRDTYSKVGDSTFTALECAIAAKYGQLDCLQYLHEHGCPWDERTSFAAAEKGQLACLQYVIDHGCSWNSQTMNVAANYGRLDCLKYLCSLGTSILKMYGSAVCSAAAMNGHLECVKYLHENGCPWDIWTVNFAAINGHLNCVQYAHEHGCGVGEKMSRMFISPNCADYLREHGVDFPGSTVFD